MSAPVSRGVALLNLGCRVNRVELDLMASELERAGVSIVDEKAAAAVVINTCAVTGEAEAKTRKAVRHAATLPQVPLVVATGCVANLFADELAAIAPNVVVEAEKHRVSNLVLEELGVPAGGVDDAGELVASTPTPTGRTRPGIKIQDGCNNRCTYCIVWKARGRGRSVDPAKVVDEVRAAQGRGAHEVVLTGINLGDYRFYDEAAGRELRLPGLLRILLENTSIERIRLSSIEPPDVTRELCRTMAEAGERVAPFLHVCLQSGSDSVLRRMARIYRADDFRRVVETAREELPMLALGTDFIVGFPGETDAEFAESLAFAEEMRFAKMHIFRYSKRPGTPAATMPGQVPAQISAARSKEARALAARMRFDEASRWIGREDLALVQYPGRAVSGGLFDVLVDPSIPLDSLVRASFQGIEEDGTLIAETSSRQLG